MYKQLFDLKRGLGITSVKQLLIPYPMRPYEHLGGSLHNMYFVSSLREDGSIEVKYTEMEEEAKGLFLLIVLGEQPDIKKEDLDYYIGSGLFFCEDGIQVCWGQGEQIDLNKEREKFELESEDEGGS